MELVKGEKISLALIDIQMPDLNGYELANEINSKNKDDKIPIIFLTAYHSDESQILKGFEVGAVDLIIKPFNKQILLSKINVFIELFKQKQENLKQQVSLEKAMEIGNIGSWEFFIDSNSMSWSEQNYKIFGLPLNTSIDYEKFLSLIYIEDQQFVNNQWIQALKGKPYDTEYRLVCKSHIKWIREKAIVEFDENGFPLRAIGFTQDITERKKVEEAIKVKEAFNYAVFEYNPIPAIVVDLEGEIVDSNLAQKKFSRRHLNIGDVMYKDYASKHKIDMYGELMSCIKTAFPKTFPEVKYKKKYLSITMAPFIKGAIITCIDISERKKTELKLEKARVQLELLNKHQINAREEERAKISLAIHDELGQSMTALKIDLNWLRENLNDRILAKLKLGKMINMINDVIKRVQRISGDLRPGLLDDLGLVSAIEWYCSEFQERTKIKCILEMDESLSKNTEIELALYRILQEALTNIIRHSRASAIKIKLHQSKKALNMIIEDNGIGIPKDKIKSIKSLGIIGIKERARQCGGAVMFSSKQGLYTKISILIPSK